jgi:hypothetical protein
MSILHRTGVFLFATSFTAFAISLGGILYQHLVEFPNWKRDMPDSLTAYRSFFRQTDFGKFFKVFMPLSFLSLLVAIFLLWKAPMSPNKWMVLAMTGLILQPVSPTIFSYPNTGYYFQITWNNTP